MPARVGDDKEEGHCQERRNDNNPNPESDAARDGQSNDDQRKGNERKANEGACERRDAGWELLAAAGHGFGLRGAA